MKSDALRQTIAMDGQDVGFMCLANFLVRLLRRSSYAIRKKTAGKLQYKISNRCASVLFIWIKNSVGLQSIRNRQRPWDAYVQLFRPCLASFSFPATSTGRLSRQLTYHYLPQKSQLSRIPHNFMSACSVSASNNFRDMVMDWRLQKSLIYE